MAIMKVRIAIIERINPVMVILGSKRNLSKNKIKLNDRKVKNKK
jgi:hypothetical protein